MEAMGDLVIVGAGPAGLMAGLCAKRLGLDYTILEAGTVCQSIVEYPIGTRFFSPADELAIGGYPFPTPHDEKPTREMALVYYRKVASAEGLNIRTYERVVKIEQESEGLCVQTLKLPHAHERRTYRTRAVLLCTGVWGQPRRLRVPGEDLPHVLQRYDEPTRFWHQRVLIVGSGNSAGECAIRLSDAEAQVWLAVAPPDLESCKLRPFILRELHLRLEEQRLHLLTCVQIHRIDVDCVELSCAEGVQSLPVDFVLTFIGMEADQSLLASLGIPLTSEGKPVHDPETYETPVRGVFVAGALSRDGVFSVARERIEKIVAHIAQRR